MNKVGAPLTLYRSDSDGLLDIFWTSPASVVLDAAWRQGPVGTFTAQAPLAGLPGWSRRP